MRCALHFQSTCMRTYAARVWSLQILSEITQIGLMNGSRQLARYVVISIASERLLPSYMYSVFKTSYQNMILKIERAAYGCTMGGPAARIKGLWQRQLKCTSGSFRRCCPFPHMLSPPVRGLRLPACRLSSAAPAH